MKTHILYQNSIGKQMYGMIFFCLASTCLFASLAKATNRAAIVLAEQDAIPADLINAYNQVHDQDKKFDPSILVPSQANKMEGKQVVKAMADKSLQIWWNSDDVKQSSLGSRADKVEKNLQQDVTVQEQNGVSHKFTFQVQPVQTQANINYTGYANARIYFEATEATSGLEVYESIGKNKKISLAQVNKSQENVSQVNWSMSW
jgi:hypothetical protein